jgi:hypothetical protein
MGPFQWGGPLKCDHTGAAEATQTRQRTSPGTPRHRLFFKRTFCRVPFAEYESSVA